MSIRVLQVLDALNNNSGVSSIILNYYRNMDKQNVNFDFLIYEDCKEEVRRELAEGGSRVYYIPLSSMRDVKGYYKNIKKFFQFHKDYEIVHVHVPILAFIYLRAAKCCGIPIRIMHSHNAKFGENRLKSARNHCMIAIGIHYANCYFSCGKKATEKMFGRKRKVYQMNNAIDIDRYLYNEKKGTKIRDHYNLENRYVIGHVGRLSKQKNHAFLFRVFREYRKQHPDAVLMLLGDGGMRDELERMVLDYGMESNVIFAGIQPNVEDFLQAFDLFLLPSFFEGFPVALVEAQAAGVPCIVSNTVDPDVNLTGEVSFLSIDDTAVNEWVESIEGISRKHVNYKELLREKGYDIKTEAWKLEQYYLTLRV